MSKIIAVVLRKGGVGKTTTAQHLAHALAMMERRVLLVDVDAQGSLSQRYEQSLIRGTLTDVLGGANDPTKTLQDVISLTYIKNLFLVAANEELDETNRRLDGVQNKEFVLDLLFRGTPLPFDYVIIDTPPGKSNLQTAALVAADEVIVPVQLAPMGFEGFEGIDRMILEARTSQQIRGQIRLRYRAIVPTFFSSGEITSDGFYEALLSARHPDMENEPLPLSMPVVETTAFERASTPIQIADTRRARTIFEMRHEGEGSPTARGQEAYIQLAQMVNAHG